MRVRAGWRQVCGQRREAELRRATERGREKRQWESVKDGENERETEAKSERYWE